MTLTSKNLGSTYPKKWLKLVFFAFIVKPIVLIGLGLNIIHRPKLPLKGPAVIVANHTSHLDTLVLMSLYPLSIIRRIRPVAAADYFMTNSVMRFFSLKCMDIIPLDRKARKTAEETFQECHQALIKGDILILFPEGTRSMTEERDFKLKRGIHILMAQHKEIPVIPVILRGLGKSLPKGEALFVPFNCEVIIGDKLPFQEDATQYLIALESAYHTLIAQSRIYPLNSEDH